MLDGDFTELTKPPEFETRAEGFLERLRKVRDDIGFVYGENLTKTSSEKFQRGVKFFNAEDFPEINKEAEKLQRSLDIDSATKNEILVILLGDTQEYVKKNIGVVDKIASEFDGKQIITQPEIFELPEDAGGDFSVDLNYIFAANNNYGRNGYGPERF